MSFNMSRYWFDIYIDSRLEQWNILEEIGEDDIRKYLDIKNGKIIDTAEIEDFKNDYFNYDIGIDKSDVIDKLDTDDLKDELEDRGYTCRDDDEDEEDDEFDWYDEGKLLARADFIGSINWLKGFRDASRMVTKDELKEHLNKLIDLI